MSEGRTIFLSSHVLAEIEQIADEVVIIHRGKFVEHASTAELARARRAGSAFARRRSTGCAPFWRKPGSRSGASKAICSLPRTRPPPRWAEIAAANGIVLHELVAEVSTLEEAFLELTT